MIIFIPLHYPSFQGFIFGKRNAETIFLCLIFENNAFKGQEKFYPFGFFSSLDLVCKCNTKPTP